ncbi:hypothetical protein EAX61_14155 [Dokdonia sinensis]|uniref:Uncharacterized protein n=1 Tax=Dokdonia sinensis TaxID=2479847 RepID=A0A3M0FVM6_9FLAO|nr:hypothetical protein [Dokdonia sinensis]RMB56548.1 hypothetical protein EAX61_14155 [Dokdonia sinensis]
MYYNIILSIEILAAICGVIFFKKYGQTPLWPWVILLIMAPTAELIGIWYSNNITYNNHVVFNTYSFLYTLILFKIIYDHILGKSRKRLIVILLIINIVTLLINCFYDDFVTGFLTIHRGVHITTLILSLAIYLVDILKRDSVISLKQNLPLIAFSGHLLFQVIYLPIFITFEYIVSLESGGDLIYTVLHNVQGVAIIMMNVLFIFGLIWTKKTKALSV